MLVSGRVYHPIKIYYHRGYFPYHPCMVYLPAFTIKKNQSNVGKYTIHIHTWMVMVLFFSKSRSTNRAATNEPFSSKAIYEKNLLARLHGAGIDVFGQLRMGKMMDRQPTPLPPY